MELRQLKYFVKVAETLNFSEAAKALYITQSTLSQQIKQLEIELDARLFHRDHHSVWMTEAGEVMLPYARETLKSAQNCKERIQDLKNMLTGTLNIGVTYSFSTILTETLHTFMKCYPDIKLNIHYKPMEELMQMLEHNDVDFALTFRPTKKFPKVESQTLFDNHLAVLVHQSHPLAKKESVSIKDLEANELALPARGLQARNSFDSMIEGHNYRLNIKLETNEVNLLLELARQGKMLTVLSETTTYNEPELRSIPIDLTIKEMEGCIHTQKNVYMKRSAAEFINMLRKSVSGVQQADKTK